VPPALCSSGMIYQLGKAKKNRNLAETCVCSPASLPCPSGIASCSSRDWGEKQGQKESRKGNWIPHVLWKCPTTSSSTGEVQVQQTDLVRAIALQLPLLRWMLWLPTTQDLLHQGLSSWLVPCCRFHFKELLLWIPKPLKVASSHKVVSIK